MGRHRFALLRWVLLGTVLAAGCGHAGENSRSLTILHTNDLHARLLPDEGGHGGFAELATAIKQESARSEATLVLEAGDLVQGTPVSSIYNGLPCYEIASLMGFDVGTIGNHEFDYTWKRMPAFFQAAGFPIVCSNIVNSRGELLAEKPYVILERNGLRIAVIGALLEGLDRISKRERRGPYKLLPAAETVRRYASEVRDKVDLVVVLGHLFDPEEKEILETVPDVDVLVGGHNHRGQTEASVVDGRIGVKVRSYGRELGRLDLRVDPDGGRVRGFSWKRIPISAGAYPPDPAVAERVAYWEGKVSELVDVPIAFSRRRLDQGAVLRLIEESMMDAVGADLAYMNRGGVRDTLPAGKILVRHAWNICPFGNAIVYGMLRGDHVPPPLANGRDLIPHKEYLVATNDFIAAQWKGQYAIHFSQTGPLVREALIDYLKQKKELR